MPDIFDEIEQLQMQPPPSRDIFDEIETTLPPSVSEAPIAGEIQQTIPKAIQEVQAPLTAKEVITGAVENIPGSAAEFAKGVAQPFLHPIETAKSIGILASGIVQKFTPGIQPDESAVDAIGDFFLNRYGSLEATKRTIATDPVGFTADLSLFLTAGGSVVAKLGKVAKLSRTAAIAGKVATVGKALDPLRLSGLALKPVAKAVGKAGKIIVGNVLTGVGEEVFGTAFTKSRGFRAGLSGQVDMDDVLRASKGALENLKETRSLKYRARLERISTSSANIDIRPIRRKLLDKLDDFKVRIDPAGGLDFSNSVISDPGAITDVNNVYNDIMRWDATPGNLTPAGMDILKRRLDNQFAPNKISRAVVTDMRDTVKKAISDKVPKYTIMTKEYSEASGMIQEIEKALSLGTKASADTAIRKFNSLMKSNNEFRRSLMKTLQESSDVNILDQIAGITANKWQSQTIVGKLTEVGIGFNVLYEGLATVDPKVAVAFLMTSPKVMAETVNLMGKIARAAKKLPPVAAATFQTGRAAQEINQAGIPAPAQPQLSELQ